jgi:hypothetical protein
MQFYHVTAAISCYCERCKRLVRIILEEKMYGGFHKVLYCPEDYCANGVNSLYFFNDTTVRLCKIQPRNKDRIISLEVVPLDGEKYATKGEEENYTRCEIIGDIEYVVSSWEQGLFFDDWNNLRQRALRCFNENYGITSA